MDLSLVFVLVIFGVILVLATKIQLGSALLIGTVLVGIFFRMSPAVFVHSIFRALVDPRTLNLLASIFLILILNETLKTSGQMEVLVQSSIKLLHDVRLTTFFLPTLVGMLPLPGGAYFSAPMVDSILKKTDISPEKKIFANYWFRHTGEYINPIYPGIVATATLTGINFRTIVKSNIWLTIMAIIVGSLIVFGRGGKKFSSKTASLDRGNLNEIKLFLKGTFPIVAIFVMVIFFGIDIVLSLIIGVCFLLLRCRLSGKEMAGVLKKSASLQMLCMILGIVFFQHVLSDCGAVEKITTYLQSSGIGLLPVIAFVPFLSGLVTGLTVAFVGLSLPLLLPLLSEITPWNIMFIFACGFAGVLLSPVHLCLVLTCEYFKVKIFHMYKYLIPATLTVTATGLIGYFISLK